MGRTLSTGDGVRDSGGMASDIARVAARLFASRGYDATSVRTIVEAAGVTKPTLYYHFGSKAGLAKALLTDPMTELVATLRGCLVEGSDPVLNLSSQVNVHFQFMRADPDRGRFFYALFFGPISSSLSMELGRFGREISQAMMAGVVPLVDAGRIDRDRAERFATALRGTIVVHTLDFLYPLPQCGPGLPTDDGPGLARMIVDDLIRGFGTRPTN